jgi:hypothetical protein
VPSPGFPPKNKYPGGASPPFFIDKKRFVLIYFLAFTPKIHPFFMKTESKLGNPKSHKK